MPSEEIVAGQFPMVTNQELPVAAGCGRENEHHG